VEIHAYAALRAERKVSVENELVRNRTRGVWQKSYPGAWKAARGSFVNNLL